MWKTLFRALAILCVVSALACANRQTSEALGRHSSGWKVELGYIRIADVVTLLAVPPDEKHSVLIFTDNQGRQFMREGWNGSEPFLYPLYLLNESWAETKNLIKVRFTGLKDVRERVTITTSCAGYHRILYCFDHYQDSIRYAFHPDSLSQKNGMYWGNCHSLCGSVLRRAGYGDFKPPWHKDLHGWDIDVFFRPIYRFAKNGRARIIGWEPY